MHINSILTQDRTHSGLQAASKKKAIELASISIADSIVELMPELTVGDIYRGLIEREKLGTTAIGKGVAIPHCRLKACETIVGGLFVLTEAVDFGAYDDEPVNIMFILLVPEAETTEHLQALAMLAERFEIDTWRQSLLDANDSASLFAASTADITNSGQANTSNP